MPRDLIEVPFPNRAEWINRAEWSKQVPDLRGSGHNDTQSILLVVEGKPLIALEFSSIGKKDCLVNNGINLHVEGDGESIGASIQISDAIGGLIRIAQVDFRFGSTERVSLSQFAFVKRHTLERSLELSLWKSSFVDLVKGNWDKVNAAFDNILTVKIYWDGDQHVSKALEDQPAILSKRFMVGCLGNVQLLIRSIRSGLAGESRHGGNKDVIGVQGETCYWMPRHLRLVPLTNEDGQSVSGNLHMPQFALSPNAEDYGIASEVNVEVR